MSLAFVETLSEDPTLNEFGLTHAPSPRTRLKPYQWKWAGVTRVRKVQDAERMLLEKGRIMENAHGEG